ncbi:hypothetical protein CVT24_001506 [Panaeolus cyanescens]|uniref:Uncharacterized protein n=1 Tax=Panaeolus cyanescens TaxID=181874 RepID=A0A409YF83_9AGAR|nr:hypothetical protein CVT24_001506 [Panaeolus cyanescens]
MNSQRTPHRRSLSPVDSARSSRAVAQTYLNTKDSPMSSNKTLRHGTMDFWMPEDNDVHEPSINTRFQPAKLMLPWTLPIPEVREIDAEQFQRRFNLDGQHPSLIRQNLVSAIKQFTEGVNGASLKVEKTYNLHALPRFIHTEFKSPDGINPTHLLAISNHAGKITFYPVHSIVMASNCGVMINLPPSPITHGMTPRTKSAADLAVQVLPLPFPDAFPTFYAYVYRKNLKELRDILVTQQLPTSLANAQYLPPGLLVTPGSEANADTQPTIKDRRTRIALNIYGVWAIARKLKFVDADFYKVVKECYDEVVAPLKIAAGYRRPSFSHDWLPPNTLASSPTSSSSDASTA